MKRILVWTETDISGLRKAWGLDRVLTEVDDYGSITREVGFDGEGNIVHRHPGAPTRANYGVFDRASVAPSEHADMTAEEFERLWSA
jgi:hypothetical protein